MHKDKIVRNLLEKSAQAFIQSKKENEERSALISRTERQAHYEQNYKKK